MRVESLLLTSSYLYNCHKTLSIFACFSRSPCLSDLSTRVRFPSHPLSALSPLICLSSLSWPGGCPLLSCVVGQESIFRTALPASAQSLLQDSHLQTGGLRAGVICKYIRCITAASLTCDDHVNTLGWPALPQALTLVFSQYIHSVQSTQWQPQ